MSFGDGLEKRVALMLEKRNILFEHESEKGTTANEKRLDFYLPEYEVFIEIKRHRSPRTGNQIARVENIILIQGEPSLKFLESIL